MVGRQRPEQVLTREEHQKIGDDNPHRRRERAIFIKTADYAMRASDEVILIDASGASVTITLPPAKSVRGLTIYIKKIDSSTNTMTIDGDGSETIDDQSTQVISIQYTSLTLMSDGTEFWIL